MGVMCESIRRSEGLLETVSSTRGGKYGWDSKW